MLDVEQDGVSSLPLDGVEFVEQCPAHLRCRRCSTLDTPLNRARCGHGFCTRCVNFVRAARFQCPVDSRSVEKKELTLDNGIKDQLLELSVFCLQRKRGCKRSVLFKELESHLESCGYVQVTCPCNCGLQVNKRDLADHLSSNCDRRLVNCEFCQDEVVHRELQVHNGLCTKQPVTCPHCKGEIRREQMSSHEYTCPMKPRECCLIGVGCTFKGTMDELERHEEDMGSHVIMMATSVAASRRQMAEMEDKIAKTDEENRKLRDELQDIHQVLSNLKTLEETLSAMQTKIKNLEIAEHTVEEMNETLVQLKKYMERMQPAVVQDHKSKSPTESYTSKSPTESIKSKSPTESIKSPDSKTPPKGLFHNSSFEERQKHAAPPTDL